METGESWLAAEKRLPEIVSVDADCMVGGRCRPRPRRRHRRKAGWGTRDAEGLQRD